MLNKKNFKNCNSYSLIKINFLNLLNYVVKLLMPSSILKELKFMKKN